MDLEPASSNLSKSTFLFNVSNTINQWSISFLKSFFLVTSPQKYKYNSQLVNMKVQEMRDQEAKENIFDWVIWHLARTPQGARRTKLQSSNIPLDLYIISVTQICL